MCTQMVLKPPQHAAAEQRIISALQVSALMSAAGASTAQLAPILGLGECDSTRPLGLGRLRRFSSDFTHSPELLCALAACSKMTKLELSVIAPASNTSTQHAALGRLCSLQQLVWTIEPSDSPVPASFAAAVQKLQHLTKLVLGAKLPVAALQQLPTSLQHLQLELHHDAGPAATLDLQHLSKVTTLELSCNGGISAACTLPTPLTRFMVKGPCGAVAGLQQLKSLFLKTPAGSCPLLQRLPALPKLRLIILILGDCSEVQQRLHA